MFLSVSYTKLARSASSGTEARRRYAAEAIRWDELQESLFPQPSLEGRGGVALREHTRLGGRGTRAWLAFEAGDTVRAQLWAGEATRLLDLAASVPWMTAGSPSDAWNVEQGHTVLGRIAIDTGEIGEAERQLSLAADARFRVRSRIVLGDPDFTLARELLERGRIEPVLAYLESCRGTWAYGDQHIDRWMEAIKAGREVDLDPWRSSKPSPRLTLRSLRFAFGPTGGASGTA